MDVMKQKKYCVIGDPVAHSKSPMLFEEIFDRMRALGMDEPDTEYTYSICKISTGEELTEFFSDMKKGAYDGCNVTMPWKTRSDLFVEKASVMSSVISAVNTVAVRDGVICGHSTDGDGMLNALTAAGASLPVCKLVLLGSGGAARSIFAAFILAKAAGKITVVSRKSDNLLKMKAIMEHESIRPYLSDCSISFVDFDDTEAIAEEISDSGILINATPIGMGDDRDSTPVPASFLHVPGLIVADAVYEPMETRLLTQARAAGCTVVPGIEMLKGQAIESARFFGLIK